MGRGLYRAHSALTSWLFLSHFFCQLSPSPCLSPLPPSLSPSLSLSPLLPLSPSSLSLLLSVSLSLSLCLYFQCWLALLLEVELAFLELSGSFSCCACYLLLRLLVNDSPTAGLLGYGDSCHLDPRVHTPSARLRLSPKSTFMIWVRSSHSTDMSVLCNPGRDPSVGNVNCV